MIKNVRQYGVISNESDMRQLLEIAKDYSIVKNYVYRRYSGIKSISKLTAKYDVQNEMTVSGLRQELGLPSAYFYPAVSDALADIKTGWSQVKTLIIKRSQNNDNFTEAERNYIYRMVKTDHLFAMVLAGTDVFDEEALLENSERGVSLNHYIRRQVRKLKPVYCVKNSLYFRVNVKGYLYQHKAIHLTTKVKRQRVEIPLTDGNEYDHQLEVSLFPEEKKLIINIPIEVKVRRHIDYKEEIGVAIGYETMITVSNGHIYGGQYGSRRNAWLQRMDHMYAEHRNMEARYQKYMEDGNYIKAENIEKNNLGRKKYERWRQHEEAAIKAYINAEIDRLLQCEKPCVIYIIKSQEKKSMTKNWSPAFKRKLSLWQKGYIRERLAYKCSANGIKLVDVFLKDSSYLCSQCLKPGIRKKGSFFCGCCGHNVPIDQNIAENILKSGQNVKRNG